MYTNRLLMIFIIGAFLFSRIIIDWWSLEATNWYQPYLFWALLIFLSFWIGRSEDVDGR